MKSETILLPIIGYEIKKLYRRFTIDTGKYNIYIIDIFALKLVFKLCKLLLLDYHIRYKMKIGDPIEIIFCYPIFAISHIHSIIWIICPII